MLFDSTFNHYSKTPNCDERTDGQTVTTAYTELYSIASHGSRDDHAFFRGEFLSGHMFRENLLVTTTAYDHHMPTTWGANDIS